MNSVFFYDYAPAALGICESGGAVCRVFFGRETPAGFTLARTPLIQKAADQLGEYFGGKRKTFDLPLAPRGTPFQQAVWDALRTIPFGQTRAYGEIARQIKRPRACRAVGMANNRNPIVIIIPCHRVIARDGALTGYGGGLGLKSLLLGLERAHGA